MRPTMSVVLTPSVRLISLNLPMLLAYAYASLPSACLHHPHHSHACAILKQTHLKHKCTVTKYRDARIITMHDVVNVMLRYKLVHPLLRQVVRCVTVKKRNQSISKANIATATSTSARTHQTAGVPDDFIHELACLHSNEAFTLRHDGWRALVPNNLRVTDQTHNQLITNRTRLSQRIATTVKKEWDERRTENTTTTAQTPEFRKFKRRNARFWPHVLTCARSASCQNNRQCTLVSSCAVTRREAGRMCGHPSIVPTALPLVGPCSPWSAASPPNS